MKRGDRTPEMMSKRGEERDGREGACRVERNVREGMCGDKMEVC